MWFTYIIFYYLYVEDTGCWFLDTGSYKEVSLFLSSIKHPVTDIIAFIKYRFIFTQSRKAGKEKSYS
jgi:hypothetical protein